VIPDDARTRAFRRAFRGQLIWPTDPDYHTLRLVDSTFNDRFPALIARVRDAGDIASAIRFARDSGLPLAVRSGGHSVAGHSAGDGTLVIDVRGLDSLEIDPAGRTAWAGAGVTTGQYTRAAEELGLATPFGDHGTVGLSGIALGGGIGWLVRKHGLTIDNIRSFEVVTADGETLVASDAEHPDLFWALRGGGGNFGVVTRLRLALHALGPVLHGTIVMASTFERWRQLLALGLAAPDELTLMPGVMLLPPMDGVPADEVGRPGLFIDALWAGDPTDGQRVLAGIRALGPVLLDDVREKPYSAVFPEPTGNRSGWTARGLFLDRFEAPTLETIERHLGIAPPGETFVHLRILGGAAARVDPEATAYGWRNKHLLAWIIADAGSEDATNAPAFHAWASAFHADLRTWGSAEYVNFMADEGANAAVQAYPAATLRRLQAVKARYDPDNLFRGNQNIRPAAAPC
jgi:FAD/FMN-containing dehydrogenase